VLWLWRREWDSNPRYGFPHTRFPSVRLKPLGHLSEEAFSWMRARIFASEQGRQPLSFPQHTENVE
jgi:hypothetical protein